MSGTRNMRDDGATTVDDRLGRPKTSAAAVFGLVFGLSALFCALTAVLSPVAVVFGLLAIVLSVVGLSKAKRPNVTGRGVALGGLVLGILGLILGGTLIAGLTTVLNDQKQVDRIERRLDDLKENLPTEVPTEVPTPGSLGPASR
jgi:hypothetical protein